MHYMGYSTVKISEEEFVILYDQCASKAKDIDPTTRISTCTWLYNMYARDALISASRFTTEYLIPSIIHAERLKMIEKAINL